jgi:type I restriction enzyme M protein
MEPWLEKLDKILKENFGTRSFSFNQATELLQVKEKLNSNQVGVAFSKLRKYGLIRTNQDPNDARKRKYRLIPQNERLKGDPSQKLGSPEKLVAIIFKAADMLRKRGGDRFLPLLFSFQIASEAGELNHGTVRRKGSGIDLNGGKTHPKFVIQAGYSWQYLGEDPARIVETLIRGLKAATKNNPAIEEAFPIADFQQFARKPENADAIKKFFELTSAFLLHQYDPSELSEAYEALLALSAFKKKQTGIYSVPRDPVLLLTEILDPQPGDSIFNPTLGLGTTFVLCSFHVRKKYGEDQGRRLSYFGQEGDTRTLAQARQNLLFNGVTDAQLSSGNALLHSIIEGERLKTFNVVIACPPWGGEGYPEGVIKKSKFWSERFRYSLPSRKTLEGAWVQIALASTADEGRAGLLINSGFLSRGGRDEAVREGIVTDDVLEAVILLPPKVIPFVGLPGTILVLNKRKHPLRKEKIVFINLGMGEGRQSEDSGQGRLGEEERRRIVEVFRDFKEVKGFSRIVGRNEIQSNAYSLIPDAYINVSEKAGSPDVFQAWKNLRTRESALQESNAQLEKNLRDLGLLKAGKGGNP